MTKNTFLLTTLFCVLATTLSAQNNTEVYLFELSKEGQAYALADPVNISDNPGYDNQPHFLPDGSSLLFSATRNGQTDVLRYHVKDRSKTWLTQSQGSEYSPTVIPDQEHFSTIILEEDGRQQLWKYALAGGEPELLIGDIVIGYHAWYNDHVLYSFVLGQTPTLQRSELNTGHHTVITESPGRSLHKIPTTGNISFVDKSDSTRWVIKSIHPEDGSIENIVETLPGSEDMAWTPGGHIMMGQGSKLYVYRPSESTGWEVVADLHRWGLSGITRLAVSPEANLIAIVVQK